jgi:hypothetical protein
MNLDDRVPLRGWIKHITWTELDSQLPEAGTSSRKRLKTCADILPLKRVSMADPERPGSGWVNAAIPKPGNAVPSRP